MFKIENCFNYLVVVYEEELKTELIECMQDNCTTINWNNFSDGDIYYNNNGEEYKVRISHHMEMVILERI